MPTVALFGRHHHSLVLVLLAVRMPGLDGPQTLTFLRALHPAVRCCFMTGKTGWYSEDDLLALGASRVLSKPFARLPDLTRTLQEVTADRQAFAAEL